MASQNNPLKNLEESPEFTKKRDKFFKDIKLYDEVVYGITFSIAKSPEFFPEIKGTGIRIAKTYKINDIPGLTFYFKEYDEKIVLLDLEITPDE